MGDGLEFVETEVVTEEEEELLLHEIDLGDIEQFSVGGPMLILGRRVIEVFGGDDEGGKKDAVTRTGNTYGRGRKERMVC